MRLCYCKHWIVRLIASIAKILIMIDNYSGIVITS